MKRCGNNCLAWLLILAVLAGGVQTAFATAAHAEHAPATAQNPVDDAPGESHAHDDHCCHLAGHMVGAVTESGAWCADRAVTAKGQPLSMHCRFGEPPPIPPPTS